MEERYNTLYRLKPNEYINGCPVILENGALLFDTVTKKILAQLKFQIISDKKIWYVSISVQEQDAVGKVLGIQKHEYSYLNAGVGEYFGEQVPIYLESTHIRSCAISVEKVVFEDNTEWLNENNTVFQALPERKAFSEDHEVIQQLHTDINSKAKYHPYTAGDLWMCTCGTYNKNEREKCSHCNAAKDLVFSVSPDKLKEERKTCVEKEQQKNKKLLKILVSLASIVVAVSLIGVGVSHHNNFKAIQTANEQKNRISGDGKYSVAVIADGTVAAVTGGNLEDLNKQLEDWTDIKSVAVGAGSVIGLKNDGTVVGCMIHDSGIEDCGQTDVDDWSGVVSIAAGDYNTVGLLEDGTVISTDITDNQYDFGQTRVDSWSDITELSASQYNVVGLKKDGTVISTKITGTGFVEDYGQTDVSDWKNIESISASDYHTVGLKKDGTVVSTEINPDSPDYVAIHCLQTEVGNWKNIVAVATGKYHTVGLKKDGTVISTGVPVVDDDYGQAKVDDWEKCQMIAANDYCTIGITKKEGKTISTVDDGALRIRKE